MSQGQRQFPRPHPFASLLVTLAAVSGLALEPVGAQGPALTVQRGEGAQLELIWPATVTAFSLERADTLGGNIVWQPVAGTPVLKDGRNVVTVAVTGTDQYFRLNESAIRQATTLRSSPAHGESGVSVNRETVFDFSGPLAADTVLDTDTFHAEFGGRRLLARTELSSDRRRASLFYLEPLPARARVVVTFDGNRVTDAEGRKVDGDGDGIPGGAAQTHFDTMSNARVAGTAVIGRVFAAEAIPAGNGVTNRPLEGVTITVDGAEESQRVLTDESGFFELSPCPAGRFFVHVDGRTAVGSDWPSGDYYPVVGKPFDAVAGVMTNLAGGTGEIFLPLVRAGTLQSVSATQPTIVSFPAAVTAENPALAGVSVTVPPNSLFSDSGARGGRLGIAPVPPERLPTPLPEGLNFPLVITVQTDGPLNLDVPAPVRFPNLPDPVTGLKPGPGEKSGLWSYNHDSGRWELQGSVTVTADGNFVESDPGVGIRQPGWHGVTPGGSGDGGGGDDDTDDPCAKEEQAVEDALFGCALGAALELAELAPGLGCAISISSSIISILQDCTDLDGNCAASLVLNSLFGAAGCVPSLGLAAGVVQCALSLGTALGELTACEAINSEEGLGGPAARAARPAAIPGFPETPIEQQLRISGESHALLVAVLGDERWVQASSADPSNMKAFGTALTDALSPTGEAGNRISATERSALLSLPAPGGLTSEVRSALLDRMDRFSAGGITPAEIETIRGAANALNATALELQQRGWRTTLDGFKETANQSSLDFERRRAGFPVRQRVLLFRLDDLTTGVVRRGQTDALGRLRSIPLQPDRDFAISYVDPLTLASGVAFFSSGPAGTFTSIPRARMTNRQGPDSDGDGLQDQLEEIVGTNPEAGDSDNDGASDVVEVQTGQNPLDGFALREGIVASVPLGGRAYGLCVDRNTAYVANGTAGLALVDVADPLSPVQLGTLGLEGESWDVAYSPEHRVVGLIARPDPTLVGERGLLHFVDAADPNRLRLKQSYSIPVSAIDEWNGLFYVALGRFGVNEVRIYDPHSALEVAYFTTADFPTGLLVTAGRAYVSTGSGLEVYDVTPAQPVRLGRLAGTFTPEILGKVHLALDGTTLFVGKAQGPVTIDVSNPAAPTFLGQPSVTPSPLALRAMALNGGAKMVGLTTINPAGSQSAVPNLTVYDVSNPTNVNAILFAQQQVNRSRDLVIVNGFALLADDSAGLSVVSYLGADFKRIAPTITFDPSALDRDPNRAGIQAIAGSTLRLAPTIRDDAQVARTELLVNGVVVDSRRSYPASFEYPLPVPDGTAGSSTLTVRIRAVDNSANVSETAPFDLELVPDQDAPAFAGSTPPPGGITFPWAPLTFRFNESLGAADPAKPSLTFLGADGAAGGGDDAAVTLGRFSVAGTLAYLHPAADLVPGRYQVALQAGAVTDRSGNPVADGFAATFEVVDERPDAAIWISDTDGNFSDPTRWHNGHVPNQTDVVLRRFIARPTVTVDAAANVKTIVVDLPMNIGNRGSLVVLKTFVASAPIAVPQGNLTTQGAAAFEQGLSITGGTVSAQRRIEIKGPLSLNHGGSLTMDGPDSQLVVGGGIEAANCTIGVKNGAVLELPQFTTLESLGDFTSLFPIGTSFRSQSPGSRLTLPNLVSANGPVDWNARGVPSIRFEAVSGGELLLPKLTTLTGRTALAANGTGCLLDAPLLTSVVGPDSAFESAIEPSGTGRVQVPALARLEHCNVAFKTDGLLIADNLEVAESSSVAGLGSIQGNVVNRGTLKLDQASGSLRILGNLQLGETSVLNPTLGFGAAKTDAGRLEVTGDSTLGGTLLVAKAAGYTPAAGQTFSVATFSTPPTGSFSTVESGALGALLKAEASVTSTELRIGIVTGP